MVRRRRGLGRESTSKSAGTSTKEEIDVGVFRSAGAHWTDKEKYLGINC